MPIAEAPAIMRYGDPAVAAVLLKERVAVTIRLTKGQVALIDLEDEARVRQHRWHAKRDSSGYWRAHTWIYLPGVEHIKKNRVDLTMHRFIANAEPSEKVDHWNGDTLDNRKENLRCCSNKQNCRNTRPHIDKKTSMYKGVYLLRADGMFRAHITCNGRKINLGNFHDEEQAAIAYDVAARKLFGEFARCNFAPNGVLKAGA